MAAPFENQPLEREAGLPSQDLPPSPTPRSIGADVKANHHLDIPSVCISLQPASTGTIFAVGGCHLVERGGRGLGR